ncbi:uncharacterized protein LOC132742243 [Ruditapes philippinarum]|uniref:uncharacterized protein LOC132742243 n=1 Tax=Ruditapes philippinarum TaxID=129788 RepID=UPI00295B6982|nr:uncharacterized protein LOC132742243 [Ruditapes philippinarum]
MDKGSVRYFIYSLLITIITISLSETTAEESCEESLNHTTQNNYEYTFLWSAWRSTGLVWHNMTFWDGHVQIPEKDHVALECFTTLGNILVIEDKHPNIEDITENIIEVKACTIDVNQKCIHHMNVLIRKCNGNLLYRFPLFNSTNVRHDYICLGKCKNCAYKDITCMMHMAITNLI